MFQYSGNMDTKDAVAALAALAQTSRLAVFQMLVELGPEGAHPGDLAQKLDIPPNTLSFHLKTLSQADLITAEQSGRFIRYRANFGQMQVLVDFLTRNCCGGDMSRCAPADTGCAAPKKAGAR
jgi:ArsR family transcriptional regulator